MLQNARQIRNIVKKSSTENAFRNEAYSDCEEPISKKETHNCLWSKVSNIFETKNHTGFADSLHALTEVRNSSPPWISSAKPNQFIKYTQEMLTNTASKYDISRLHFGIATSVSATLAAFIACTAWIKDVNSTVLWTSSLAVLYSFMMFASSYVEEEQLFWYWAASSWCGWLFLKK